MIISIMIGVIATLCFYEAFSADDGSRVYWIAGGVGITIIYYYIKELTKKGG